MKLSECYITIKTLMRHPEGLTIDELSKKILEYWPSEGATRCLTTNDNIRLKWLLDGELVCIMEKDGKYCFNRDSKNYYCDYAGDGMIDGDIRRLLTGKPLKGIIEERLPF